ncbi:aminopeptidase P family protein [Mesorhizobium sp. M1A.F.Ca.ET.072.01.1.1]|uniref:M24 family metallopeptidase n=1 Tax=Mesorhizobium sp. M1A.F.Ca.ET.072.01.1.1 TaxID=2496753 RepID=UPI000FD4404A|nr:M24 family metallopeptidase [Mesorhizobium sp. M1A.F.Ca.ET.072.01.1.1]RUW49843.1 aminopeptidase P family protein [Mesorhizobium sp. M1A.F.Ca.ET.072.01.1.1]TIU71804.1 MAG: M24 family metallopeptidase [Mesorhizobium sp.]TIV04252.1 MAG: M24 family metallopeptidase [Mesorhizobium sp.]
MYDTLLVRADEYQERTDALRRCMAENSVDAFVISDQDNFEYFSGFKSLFWTSKARPYFLVVLKDSDTAVVVAAAAEAKAFSQTSELPPGLGHRYYFGFIEDAVEKVIEVLGQANLRRIALDYGFESFGVGSLRLIDRLKTKFAAVQIVEGAEFIWPIRMIKTPVEIAQKRLTLEIAHDAFHRCLKSLTLGTTEKQFAKTLTLDLIEHGAESVPWLPVRFGRKDFAYSLPPTDRGLAKDDFIWVDIGCRMSGSISDVNRIAKAGRVTSEEQGIYTQVRNMTIETLSAIKPGMTGADVYAAFEAFAKQTELGLPSATASRIGHGSGRNLTEPPSIGAASKEVLQEGMIIHVEPKYELDGGVFQLEEVAVVTKEGAELITKLSEGKFPEVLV